MKLKTIEKNYVNTLDKFIQFVYGNCESERELRTGYKFIEDNLVDCFDDVSYMILLEFLSEEGFLIYTSSVISSVNNKLMFSFNVFTKNNQEHLSIPYKNLREMYDGLIDYCFNDIENELLCLQQE